MAVQQGDLSPVAVSETGARVNAVAEWRSVLVEDSEHEDASMYLRLVGSSPKAPA